MRGWLLPRAALRAVPSAGPVTSSVLGCANGLQPLGSHRGAGPLAVEAGSTFMLDRTELVELANSHRMTLVGVTTESLATRDHRKGLS